MPYTSSDLTHDYNATVTPIMPMPSLPPTSLLAPSRFGPALGSNVLATEPAHAWPVSVLGIPFDPVTIPDAVNRVTDMVRSGRPHYVVTPNVDFLVQARHDGDLHRILVQADLVLCDGKPIVWASRWLGNPLPCRVAGSDLVEPLLQRAAECGWKIMILGGSPDAGAEAARRIALAHPSLPTVSHYSPPYCILSEKENDAITEQVRAAAPDLVLVCLGCPKQEKWISLNYSRLNR